MENLNDFRKSLAFTLKWEGGYVNNPDDPGGETKWGISKRSYPDLDIRNLTPETAASIYAKDYWDACGCDAIPFPYCAVVFDSAVSSGVGQAKKWLRMSADVQSYLGFRKMLLVALANRPGQQQFLAGWLNRLQDLSKLVQVAQSEDQANEKWGGLG